MLCKDSFHFDSFPITRFQFATLLDLLAGLLGTNMFIGTNYMSLLEVILEQELLGQVIYVLQSSRIIRKSGALIVRYSQKKKWNSIVFYCSENPSISHNLGTTGPNQVGFSAKCTSPNEDFNQIENWKCQMCEFRLIPIDRITYVTLSEWFHMDNFTCSLLVLKFWNFYSLKVLWLKT